MFKAVSNSWYYISVYDDEKLIGFGRILCDGIMHALILDVIVHPERQNEGIGKEIMNRLIIKCKHHKNKRHTVILRQWQESFFRETWF